MNRIKQEFGPFHQPHPADEEEHADHGEGGTFSGEKKRIITDPDLYGKVLSDMVEKVAVSEASNRRQPTMRADIHGLGTLGKSTVYIDAMVAARRGYRFSEQRIKNTSIVKPSFFVHCYAVADMLDDRGSIPLASEDDRAGYYMSVGSPRFTEAFYLNTRTRSLVHELSNGLTTTCTTGTPPHDALRALYKSLQQSGMKYGLHPEDVIWKGVIPRVAVPDKNILYTPILKQREHITQEQPRRKSWSVYESRVRELLEYAGQPRVNVEKGGTANEKHFDLSGYYLDRREEPQRGSGIYINEYVSSFPGGVYIETKGIRKTRDRLTLKNSGDVEAYIVTIGLKPMQARMMIESGDPTIASFVHTALYEKLKFAPDQTEKERYQIEIAQSVIQEVKKRFNITIRLLK